MTIEHALEEVRSRLEKVFQNRLQKVVVYGSQARNEAPEDSDIDLMVVLEEPVKLGEDLETIIGALYPVQIELDRPIHAMPVAAEDFDAGQYTVYRHAKQEGILL